MYQVLKQVWHKDTQKYWLQYVTEYPNLVSANAHAKRLKGIVMTNGHIVFDLR